MADLQDQDPLVAKVAAARAASSRRPDRTGFGTLNSTLDGKHFYVYSGELTVTTSETSMIDIPNIGERDIRLYLEVGNDVINSSDTMIQVKSNGQVIYKSHSNVTYPYYILGHDEIKLILPAYTSLEVTMSLSGGTGDFNIAGHGDYL